MRARGRGRLLSESPERAKMEFQRLGIAFVRNRSPTKAMRHSSCGGRLHHRRQHRGQHHSRLRRRRCQSLQLRRQTRATDADAGTFRAHPDPDTRAECGANGPSNGAAVIHGSTYVPAAVAGTSVQLESGPNRTECANAVVLRLRRIHAELIANTGDGRDEFPSTHQTLKDRAVWIQRPAGNAL